MITHWKQTVPLNHIIPSKYLSQMLFRSKVEASPPSEPFPVQTGTHLCPTAYNNERKYRKINWNTNSILIKCFISTSISLTIGNFLFQIHFKAYLSFICEVFLLMYLTVAYIAFCSIVIPNPDQRDTLTWIHKFTQSSSGINEAVLVLKPSAVLH